MKVTIDISEEFVSHYKKDGFSESLVDWRCLYEL